MIDRELLRQNVALGQLTTFRIGGRAKWFAEPANAVELAELLHFAEEENLKTYILGGGSNLLIADQGLDGLVIKLSAKGEFGGIAQDERNPGLYRVGAAESFPCLVSAVVGDGFAGLEEFAGIPGSVGGALLQNAGTAAAGMGEYVVKAAVMDFSGRVRQVAAPELRFSYRGSSIYGLIALWAEMYFPARMAVSQLRKKLHNRLELKTATQPIDLASAGCIFKNPGEKSAGYYLDQAGCKGLRSGDAEVSVLHANFIVNLGKASSRDVAALVGKMRQAVRKQFGIALELEIKLWGMTPEEKALADGSDS